MATQNNNPDTPRSPEEARFRIRESGFPEPLLTVDPQGGITYQGVRYVPESATPASDRDPGLDDPDILADLLNNFETAPEHGKALARGYIERYVAALQKDRLSAPTLPEPPAKDTQWWIDEARGILTALCREDTRVIERVTRRVLIIRDEEGRVCPGDELHTEFLKAVEARANPTIPEHPEEQ